jgi:hypothetical protein
MYWRAACWLVCFGKLIAPDDEDCLHAIARPLSSPHLLCALVILIMYASTTLSQDHDIIGNQDPYFVLELSKDTVTTRVGFQAYIHSCLTRQYFAETVWPAFTLPPRRSSSILQLHCNFLGTTAALLDTLTHWSRVTCQIRAILHGSAVILYSGRPITLSRCPDAGDEVSRHACRCVAHRPDQMACTV